MTRQTYRFAEVEVDPAQGCVRRNGEERHLRQQTFQVLIYLLDQRERLVTKDELLRQVWNGTAVTDDALVQCVMDIRRALGDDSRHPRFIKTIPKIGYRFIGELEAQPTDSVATSEAGGSKSQTEVHATFSRRRLVFIAAVALVLGGVLASVIYFRHRSQTARQIAEITLTPAAGRKPIAVMYFDNQSGDVDLNWLREGLADMMITGLSRSANLIVLSRQQLHVLLERTGRNESENIQLDEALDIAQKSHARIVVLGSFARLGQQIRVDAQLHDASDGQLLAAERLVVDQPAEILTQVDLLSLKLASHLGVPAQSDSNAGLATAMTNSLEAYRYYSLGVERAQLLRSEEALSLLGKATALDPQFAMAYARIGYVYGVTGNSPDKAKPYLEKAFQLTNRLTEKDKANIAAWYAIVNFDYPAAIDALRKVVAGYPLEVEAYRRLGLLLRSEERFAEAIEVLKQGLVVDPGEKDLYNALGAVYSDMGRHDEAIATYQRYVQLAPDEPNTHDSLGLGYEWAGRYDEAIQEYNQALALKPNFEIAMVHLGNTYFHQGRYRAAIEEYQRYIQAAPTNAERSRGYDSVANVDLRVGNLTAAKQVATKAQSYGDYAVGAAYSLALQRNDLGLAHRLNDEFERIATPERGSRGTQRILFYRRGLYALKSNAPEEAIENLRQAVSHRPQTWSMDAYEDCLANAYLELDRLDDAIAEYERILKLNPNYPLVHYHLAQAYERKGQQDQARTEYERFLQVWKDADADIPEVVQARRALSGS